MTHEKFQQFKNELCECRLLEDLSPLEIEAMGEHVRFENFSEGQSILTEGLQYQGLWLILRGKCSVIKDCGSTESVLATLEPGNVFGEMSFFETVPHSATVRAVQEVTAICMTRENFDALRNSFPTITEKISINIVKLISDRLRRMDGWTCQLIESEENSKRHQEWQEFRAKLYSNLFD